MSNVVKAWQCIGCGNIDAPQTCIGICEYVKVEFVYAQEHRQALRDAERARQTAQLAAAFLRQLAHTTPRDDEWQRSYLAMQSRARALLKSIADAPSD